MPEPIHGGADKVFGIGFYKTGTTTLCAALRVLGYRTVNGDKLGEYPGADDGETLLKQIRAGDLRLPTFAMFDAFTDNPYFHLWREIRAQYPQAKYILTAREERAWLESCARFYRNRRVRPMRVWMFGPHANPGRDESSRQAWLEAYRAHNTAVRAYFAEQPAGCFFEFDPTRAREWEPLCAFLGRPVPTQPWPHANLTRPDPHWRGAWRRLKRALGLESGVQDTGDD